jgi:hypothetical protein
MAADAAPQPRAVARRPPVNRDMMSAVPAAVLPSDRR